MVADSEESIQINLKKLDETLTRWKMENDLGEDRSNEGRERELVDVVVWKLGTGGWNRWR